MKRNKIKKKTRGIRFGVGRKKIRGELLRSGRRLFQGFSIGEKKLEGKVWSGGPGRSMEEEV